MEFIPTGIIGAIVIVLGCFILKERIPPIIPLAMILIGLIFLIWAIIVGYDTISQLK